MSLDFFFLNSIALRLFSHNVTVFTSLLSSFLICMLALISSFIHSGFMVSAFFVLCSLLLVCRHTFVRINILGYLVVIYSYNKKILCWIHCPLSYQLKHILLFNF